MSELGSQLLPLFLLMIGYFSGRFFERRHFKSIRRREGTFSSTPATTSKVLSDPRPVRDVQLAVGSVVVSVDYYKRFLAVLRGIFGGEMSSYSPIIDRGRREAVLRMKESCPDADLYLNMRLETSSISKGEGKSTAGVEMLAYATAVYFQK